VEDLCAPLYAARRGRPSLPPGRYFRMLLVGYPSVSEKLPLG
jgi:transposase